VFQLSFEQSYLIWFTLSIRHGLKLVERTWKNISRRRSCCHGHAYDVNEVTLNVDYLDVPRD
jgi:hypothetical protein